MIKWHLSSKLHSILTRVATNIENEAYYNETQETSEPVFWVMFGVALLVAAISLYVTMPLQRWWRGA